MWSDYFTPDYSNISLELAIAQDPTNLSLIQRQFDQSKFVPKTEDSKPFKKQELIQWKMYLLNVYDEMKYGRLSKIIQSRFTPFETHYLTQNGEMSGKII